MHLTDEQIAMVVLGPETAEPSAGRRPMAARWLDRAGSANWAAHVAECSTCAARLNALRETLAEHRSVAAAAADAAMTGRLEHQRASVLRRIGGASTAARILLFPRRPPVRMPRPGSSKVHRAVAAAAIVGILVGTLAGGLINPHLSFWRSPAPTSTNARLAPRPATSPSAIQASAVAEERFLREFEAALGAPQVEPLRSLDAMTPR